MYIKTEQAAKPRLPKQWRDLELKIHYKKLSYCWETVRHESIPRIAEMDVMWK